MTCRTAPPDLQRHSNNPAIGQEQVNITFNLEET